MADCHNAKPKITKAIAILGGLQLCNHQGFESLIIESDSLHVVDNNPLIVFMGTLSKILGS